MYNYTRYIVVCKNERQAKLLFEQIASYWKDACRITRGLRGKLSIDREKKLIYDPLASVTVIPERKLFDFTIEHTSVNCRLVNGTYASRWLDKKFEIEEKQK